MQPKLISVKPTENYMLLLVYETSERKLFDVKPYIKGSWYGMLRESLINSLIASSPLIFPIAVSCILDIGS